MSLLPILRYPDARLHTIAQPVENFDAGLTKLASDMGETMYQANGIGLAATQVNVHQRLIVIDLSDDKSNLLVMVNPHITNQYERQLGEEGCLSVPGIFEEVERAARIDLIYYDLQGCQQEMSNDGMLAVCIQHEIDHLNGKVFLQHLSPLKQGRIRSKLLKSAREAL